MFSKCQWMSVGAFFSAWRNSVTHLCFILTSMSDAILSDCPSAAICHTATECNGILVGRFKLCCRTTNIPAQRDCVLVLWRYSRRTWIPTCVICCREPALAGGWTWRSLEVPSGPYSSVILSSSLQIYEVLISSHGWVFEADTLLLSAKPCHHRWEHNTALGNWKFTLLDSPSALCLERLKTSVSNQSRKRSCSEPPHFTAVPRSFLLVSSHAGIVLEEESAHNTVPWTGSTAACVCVKTPVTSTSHQCALWW